MKSDDSEELEELDDEVLVSEELNKTKELEEESSEDTEESNDDLYNGRYNDWN